MKGSVIVTSFANLTLREREERIWEHVVAGDMVRWPWRPVVVSSPPLHGVFYAAADYFALGEVSDFVRMPISPLLAQRIADKFGWMLPTRWMVDAIWSDAEVQTAAQPWGPPYDASMQSIARIVAHDVRINMALDKLSPGWRGRLIAGHKKDVVLSNKLTRGHVAIYGWHRANGVPIQQLNTRDHDDRYSDYSHGIRFIQREMLAHGTTIAVPTVLSMPDMCKLLSDEGPLLVLRQPGIDEEGNMVEDKVLKQGDKGSSVQDWQGFLNDAGFRDASGARLKVDGDFGAKTTFATRAFQSSKGLPVTGEVDSKTLAAAKHTIETAPSQTMFRVIPAANYTKAERTKVDLIVIHTMENPESSFGAENVAAWFAGQNPKYPPPKASAHYCLDCDSVIQCVREEDVAWHAPGANHNGIGIEHTGRANQTAEQWADDFSTRTLKLSAKLAAQICKRWDIPVEYVSAADLKAGKRGFTGHVDVTNAFNDGKGHQDPGEHFPWAAYLDMVRAEMA